MCDYDVDSRCIYSFRSKHRNWRPVPLDKNTSCYTMLCRRFALALFTHTSCRLVLQSMVPALVMKSLVFAMCRANQSLTTEGIVTGFCYTGYNWSWWFMPLKRRLQGLGLSELCLYPVFADLGGQ